MQILRKRFVLSTDMAALSHGFKPSISRRSFVIEVCTTSFPGSSPSSLSHGLKRGQTLKQGTANENAAKVGSNKGSDQRENDK